MDLREQKRSKTDKEYEIWLMKGARSRKSDMFRSSGVNECLLFRNKVIECYLI